MEFVLFNLTRHDIVVLLTDGGTLVLPPSGQVARVESRQVVIGHVGGVPVVKTEYGEVVGLPDPIPGVYYLTSTMVAAAVRRPDVLSPDTGPTAILENGRVKAVTRFQSFAE